MFYTGVLLFGVISLSFLRQELFPPITYPKLSIVTNYENAAPEEIENLITKPIEEAVGSTAGLKSLSSTSREGLSVVVAEFGWDQNMDFAALGVREKIDLMKARLPRDAQEPTVIKYNPFELPVLTISVASDKRTPVQLKRFAEKWFKDEIEKLNGVASATISGGEDEEIIVEVDQGRLKASNIGINDLSKAIASANLNYPGGTIKESFYEYLIRTMGEFKKIDEIGKVPIKKGGKSDGPHGEESEEANSSPELVLLKDIASIRRTVQERTSFSRFNGLENVTVSIQKQAHSNTIQVVESIKRRLEELVRQMPEDIYTEVVYDQSIFIRDAINGVRNAAIQGGVLAFFVLLIFLRSVITATLISIITPVTVLATFTLMYFMGISLNVISLGGIALGVGMLVDNAIVVIENAYRKFSDHPDMEFNEQIRTASEEVVTPLWASTLTTVAVFLPMIFVTGIAGQIFKELAWVVIVTQVISIVVAFTLLPILMIKFRIKGKTVDEGSVWAKRAFEIAYAPIAFLQWFFNAAVPIFMRHKGRNLMGVLCVFVLAMMLFSRLDRVMMPKVDQGQFMLKIDMPVGTRIEVSNAVSMQVENFVRELDQVKSVAAVVGSSKSATSKDVIQQIGSHQAQMIVTLHEKREDPTDDVVQKIRSHIESTEWRKRLRGGRISYLLYESAFVTGGDESAPIVINLKGSNLAVLKRLAEEAQASIAKIPGVYDTSNSLPESSPETKINVNKDKAGFYRLSVTDLATAAHVAIKGIVATNFNEEGKQIPIRVVLRERDRDAIKKLPFLLMHSPLGVDVPLADLVTFTVGVGPSEIKRVSQERTVQVYAKIYDRSTNAVGVDVQKALSGVRMPEGYAIELAGQSLEVQESFQSLRMALILSVILVYMIMAAQFESYFQPFIIMFCVPMALIGVALGLFVSGTPISVVALLGVILLGGIVVNNGIILIDFTNQLVKDGMPFAEAAIRASSIRLRPIMMTALTTILGLLPLAMSQDQGSKLQAPMGITVMGGMLVATFMTIIVIPAVYAGASQLRERFFGKKERTVP